MSSLIELTDQELKAVQFAVLADIETLEAMIKASDATIENKLQYRALLTALDKLGGLK